MSETRRYYERSNKNTTSKFIIKGMYKTLHKINFS